ncbi:MAG: UDP-N-acetylmuramoyl-L-alanyl-D-glutamate--2,6-diaminopimelate ligase [Rickettsiales bacterium]|nr:UDP-N-acetylmuramoyl-L-alanyl-D-glutamate--2,6-diaminopimelate ligase [Rickettsiales bacterium]
MQGIVVLKEYIKSLIKKSSFDSKEKIIYYQRNNIEDLEISTIEQDSRMVKNNSAFFCLVEEQAKAILYINQALHNSASVIVANFDKISYNFQELTDLNKNSVIFINAVKPFNLLVSFLKSFYSPLPQNIYAITGTNGKTSTAEFIRQILDLADIKSASIGTLGVRTSNQELNNKFINSSLTTPDIVSLYKNLAILKSNKIDDVAIEVSSIGLEQQRILGIPLAVGLFTNFTQDHLDYHQSMEAYFSSKMLLFKEYLTDKNIAILNSDIPEFAEITRICQKHQIRIIEFGIKAEESKLGNVKLLKKILENQQQNISLLINHKKFEITVNIIGDFQAMNLAGAIACVNAVHNFNQEKLQEIFDKMQALNSALGRMQKVANFADNCTIFIDYAHTPDALSKSLNLVNLIKNKGRVIVLFGCGGDRDKAKRPIMGKIASEMADIAIITDDNPRLENADAIRKDIVKGVENKNFIEVSNRENAINYAIAMMKPNDILLIAGKGHEKYQIIGSEKLEFDEEKIILTAINHLNK